MYTHTGRLKNEEPICDADVMEIFLNPPDDSKMQMWRDILNIKLYVPYNVTPPQHHTLSQLFATKQTSQAYIIN